MILNWNSTILMFLTVYQRKMQRIFFQKYWCYSFLLFVSGWDRSHFSCSSFWLSVMQQTVRALLNSRKNTFSLFSLIPRIYLLGGSIYWRINSVKELKHNHSSRADRKISNKSVLALVKKKKRTIPKVQISLKCTLLKALRE